MILLLLLSRFSRVQLCATPEMAAHQAPPSLGFSRQEHWSGLPFPSPMYESEKWKWSRSVMFDSLQPHGLQPKRLPHPWDFPGKSTGVDYHCLWWSYSVLIPALWQGPVGEVGAGATNGMWVGEGLRAEELKSPIHCLWDNSPGRGSNQGWGWGVGGEAGGQVVHQDQAEDT